MVKLKMLKLVCQLFVCTLLVNAQTNPGESPGEGKVAPKVHQVLQLDPVPIEVKTSNPNANRRDTLVLECVASGNPAPTIEWSFNSVKFTAGKNPDGTDNTDKIRHTLASNTLIIKNVRGYDPETKNYHDSGKYRCIATNEVGSVFLEKHINIRVMGSFAAGNTEHKGASTFNPTVGKDYFLTCPTHTKGYGTVYRWGYVPKNTKTPEWWYPGNPNPRVFPDYATGTLWYSVVTKDDVKQSNDIGGVRCILVNDDKFEMSNQQKLFHITKTVEITAKPRLVAKLPERMEAPVDSEYSLICGATGNPVPTISWEYQGIPVRSKYNNSEELNFEFFRIMGLKQQELRIRRVTEYSGGTFKCIASNVDGITWSQGQLTVQFPPKWIKSFPDTIDLALQNDFELICNATGTPRPTFMWYQNSTLIKNDTNGRKLVSGESVKKHNGGTLKIKNTQFDDNGIYICVAYNGLDTLTQSVFIRVQPKQPTFDVPLDDPIYLFRSEKMLIRCNPSGGPIPTKVWSKEGVVLDIDTNPRLKVLDDGSLEIMDVNDRDAGLYTCKATNERGTAESSGTAVVLKSTKINRPMEHQEHSEGWEYVVLFCGVEWDRRLDLRLEWYKEGVRMAKFSDRVYLEDRATGPPRLLYIKNLTIQDAGNYSCHAYTKVGNVISESWSSALLKIKGPPEPPAGVTIESGNCYANPPRAVLRWARGEELGAETREFYIEFSTNKSSHEGHWFGGQGDEILNFKDKIVATPGTQIRYTLTEKELVPGANLIFRIRAASDLQIGRPSRPSRLNECLTRDGVPKINPLNVTGITRGPGTLIIKWRPLTDVFYGGKDFRYEVFYRTYNKDASTGANTFSNAVIDKNLTYASEFEIPSPGENIEFEFYVKSSNYLGDAEDTPKRVRAISGRQAPKYPPKDVRVTKIDRFNVELNWTPAEDADSYRILYWNVTDAEKLRGRNKRAASDPIIQLYQYSNDKSSGTLKNLTAQVDFMASVASMNSGGVSSESELVSFKSQARVPGKPTNTLVVVYGSSAHISWNPPLHPNGYIEQYEISWSISRDKDREQAKPAERTSIKKDRRSREAYMIKDFEPFTYYDLRISARNRIGPGDDYERILFTVGAPDIPGKPGAPKAKPFDDSAINVTFQRPTYGGLPTKFYVYYRPRGDYYEPPKIVSQLFPKRAWILITGLEFLVYDFWTVGVNSLGQSETSDLTEQQPIRKLKPQAHASQFEWYRSNWFVAVTLCVLFALITMITVIMLLKDGPKTYKRLHDEGKFNGYNNGSGGYNNTQQMQPMTSKPAMGAGASAAVGAGAAYGASAAPNGYDRNFSASEADDHDAPPPRYSSASSLEKKEPLSDSETGSETGSGSDYTGSETGSGSEYSDEEDGSYYSDEEKKRPDSEDEDEDDADTSTFV